LEITEPDYNDATDYVLNPEVVTPEGEWEAWVMNWWKPSEVRRYRSFWDLMQAEYQAFYI
jgi:hypothetical protein